MTTKDQLHYSEEEWARELMRRYDYARQKGLSVWLFSFRETTNNGFGLFQFSPPDSHAIWNYLQGRKIFTYHTLLDERQKTMHFQGSERSRNQNARDNDTNMRMLANMSVDSYVFRGTVNFISATGAESEHAMRLLLNYNDANNYYFVNIEPQHNKIRLVRRQNGIEAVLKDASVSVQLGNTYDFEIRVGGSASTLQVFWNAIKVIEVTDSNSNLPKTSKIEMTNNGVRGYLTSMLFTDFESISEV